MEEFLKWWEAEKENHLCSVEEAADIFKAALLVAAEMLRERETIPATFYANFIKAKAEELKA